MKKKLVKRPNIFTVSLLLITALFMAATCCLILISCDQAPIFFHISVEPPKRDPFIAGSPTNIIYVQSHNTIYAGGRNGQKIFRNNADTDGNWREIDRPGGRLIDIATDGTNLYALISHGDVMDSTTIRRFNHSLESWDANDFYLSGYSIQTIYGAEGKIFAGARRSGESSLAILHINGSGLEILQEGNTSLLSGVAALEGIFFLATAGNGIFMYDGGISGPVSGTAGANMVGIISTGTQVLAVSSEGNTSSGIYLSSTSGNAFSRVGSRNINFSGAMCVWEQYDSENGWKPVLLLLGVGGSVSPFGYREIALTNSRITIDDSGNITNPIRSPGDGFLSSIRTSDRAKYNASIGKHPVEAILQMPQTMLTDDESEKVLPIFASTMLNGLWSHRNNEWNAEEENP